MKKKNVVKKDVREKKTLHRSQIRPVKPNVVKKKVVPKRKSNSKSYPISISSSKSKSESESESPKASTTL